MEAALASDVQAEHANKLSIELIHSWDEMNDLRAQWNSLLKSSTYPTIYSTPEFCECGWDHFHSDESEPFILAVRDQEKLVAVFPLRVEDSLVHNIEYKLITPIHTSEADKPYPIISIGYEDIAWIAFADFLQKHAHLWDILYWPELPDILNGVEDLEQAFSKQWPFIVESDSDSYGPILRLDQTWDEFKSKHRKLRKALTRINNKLDNDVHFKVYSAPDQVAKAMDIYAAIEQKSWKSEKIGIARNETYRTFYQDLSARLAINDQIKVGVLFHGNLPISAEIAYTSGDRVFFSNGTYDLAYKDYSPGKISTGLFIKEFLDCGFNYGDFLAGFAHYLSPWSDTFMTTTEIHIYNRRPAIYMIWKWRRTKIWMKERCKHNPKLSSKLERLFIRFMNVLGVHIDQPER